MALGQTIGRLHQAGEQQLRTSTDSANKATGEIGDALSSTQAAAVDALEVLGGVASAGGHAAAAAALAAAGAIVKATEAVGDLFGAALQHLGRALIGAGNWLRGHAGGAQVTVHALVNASKSAALSDRLLHKSKEQQVLAGHALMQALSDLVSSGGNIKNAATSLLDAAESVAQAAAHGTAGVALHASAYAVDAARTALDAAQRGADGAGALLQDAGKAVIAAGNALNATSGADTVVLDK